MATRSSSSTSSSAGGVPRSSTPKVIGAVAGAVIGGVLGALVVKKARAHGGARRVVPARVSPLAKRAAGAMKSLADDAKTVAKATAAIAADAALEQVKHAAQQFVADVAAGRTPTAPTPAVPPESMASANARETAGPATEPAPSGTAGDRAGTPHQARTRRAARKRGPAAQRARAKGKRQRQASATG
jgi:hypothetical protein